MQAIEKVNALKVFYYTMAIDDDVSKEELSKLDEFGKDFLDSEYDIRKSEIIEECQSKIESAGEDDEKYDIIQEAIDEALSVKAEKRMEGVLPRHLLWSILTIAYKDGDYSQSENRLISHISRVLEVEKSVLVEMKQLMITAIAIQNELEKLNQSDRAYSEIRPVVEETEKRKQILLKAVTDLINDENLFAEPEAEEKKNSLLEVEKKISNLVTPVAKDIGEKAQNSIKKASDIIEDKASKGTEELKSGANKLLTKIKEFKKK